MDNLFGSLFAGARGLRAGLCGAVALAGAAALTPPAQAFEIEDLGLTVTATPAVSNDYLFRGISQTRNNWAYSGTLDVQHQSGVYVGAFLSNAKFLAEPFNNTRQELDLLAGYRFTLANINFDIGYIAYLYPGQDKPNDGASQLNEYQEVALKATYTVDTVKLSGAFYYSPNYFGKSGDGYYLEGGVDVTLPYEFTAFGRIGYQWIQRNFGARSFGTPDYLYYAVGVQREIYAGVTAAVGWYGTDISKSECVPLANRATGGQRICDGRVLFTLSKTF
jgi:uncharacterized protein (TIGR02001 family)